MAGLVHGGTLDEAVQRTRGLACEAAFDMVEVHMAPGYLLRRYP